MVLLLPPTYAKPRQGGSEVQSASAAATVYLPALAASPLATASVPTRGVYEKSCGIGVRAASLEEAASGPGRPSTAPRGKSSILDQVSPAILTENIKLAEMIYEKVVFGWVGLLRL